MAWRGQRKGRTGRDKTPTLSPRTGATRLEEGRALSSSESPLKGRDQAAFLLAVESRAGSRAHMGTPGRRAGTTRRTNRKPLAPPSSGADQRSREGPASRGEQGGVDVGPASQAHAGGGRGVSAAAARQELSGGTSQRDRHCTGWGTGEGDQGSILQVCFQRKQ